MEIKAGQKRINYRKNKAIIEFVLQNYTIYVFQGKLSQFDILVRYNKDKGKLRTPKHIHWVVDTLMKMQANEKLTKDFLSDIKECWNRAKPLNNNDYETLKKLIIDGENYINLKKYIGLNKYGEYDVEFLYVLMELLSAQEKTNRPDAYMFGSIIDELLEEDFDIFKIVSTAGYNGRKRK